MGCRVWISAVFCALLLVSNFVTGSEEEKVEDPSTPSHVLTLDSTNFEETIAKHPFIVVEFYAPWCGHCKKLEPEYEKAASDLSKHDPPIVLAKVDANEEANKGLASKYDVSGFPTLKILRNKGDTVQDYNGPREADGIVQYLKKQAGAASSVVSSSEDADNIIDPKKVFIVGVFPEFSGKEFDSFITVAEKMRSDYDFAHTLDAKFLPKGDSKVKGPIVRLLKPFDELFVDLQDFNEDSLEKFIQDASVPLITIYNSDPNNHPFVMKFFNSPVAKALLFVNFTNEHFEEFKSKYNEVAEIYKGKDIGFLMGDLDISQGAFQYFGLKEDQAPLIVVQTTDSQKYLKANIKPLEIKAWLQEYTDGNVKPFKNSEPIPEVNNEPVKVVVGDSLQDIVFDSGKNVLLEFYAPWCGHCQKLIPILEEVAVSFENDLDVVIGKLDATANDFPKEFEVQGYPTIYFSSASGKLTQYEGGRTKEDIIDFINQNKDTAASVESEKVEAETISESESVKDEL